MSPKQYIQRYDKEKETLLISFRDPQLQFVSVSFKFVHPCLYICMICCLIFPCFQQVEVFHVLSFIFTVSDKFCQKRAFIIAP